MQKLNNDYKIHILCPSGHKLYPQGVKPKTFLKSSGIYHNNLKLVNKGYDKTKMKNFMSKNDLANGKIQISNDLPLPVYQLEECHMNQMKRKCKICSGQVVLDESNIKEEILENENHDVDIEKFKEMNPTQQPKHINYIKSDSVSGTRERMFKMLNNMIEEKVKRKRLRE